MWANGNLHHNSNNDCISTAPFFLGSLTALHYYLNYCQQPCEARGGEAQREEVPAHPAREPLSSPPPTIVCVHSEFLLPLYYVGVPLPPTLH